VPSAPAENGISPAKRASPVLLILALRIEFSNPLQFNYFTRTNRYRKNELGTPEHEIVADLRARVSAT